MQDAIGAYMTQLGRHPLLTPADERALGTRVRAAAAAHDRLRCGWPSPTDEEIMKDGEQAREAMTLANLRLVVSIARRYPRWPGVELVDLVQAGNAGLQRAVDGYDPDRGFRFSTYATRWIKQSISRSLDRCAPGGHVPVERCQEIRSAARLAEGDNDRLPERLRDAHTALFTSSLDAPGPDGVFSLVEELTDDGVDVEADVERRVTQELVRAIVGALPEELRVPVILRYGLDGGTCRTYAEIASATGVEIQMLPHLMKRSLSTMREGAGGLP